jgi:subtilisin family serine protease
VTIAILNTGVEINRPDLQANIWVNSGEIPANGIDDDGNGYVDDYHGYDFYNGDANPDDDNNHGTHVAGIAAAYGNNGLGIAGVSWRAKIMPLKMLDSAGAGNLYDLAEAIYYAADNRAQFINMSLGASCSNLSAWNSIVQPAVDYALSKNVLLIAASGNSYQSRIYCPGALDGVIAVGATTDRVSRASFSNDQAGISWTANVIPAVSWLTLSAAPSGTVSAAASPAELTLTASRPSDYGRYTTTVVISGTDSAGQTLGTRTTQVNLSFEFCSHPILMKVW